MPRTIVPIPPRFVRTPAFLAASELLALAQPVAASLPPEWRFHSVHLRRQAVLILSSLALCGGLSGKRRRKLIRFARLRAYELVGAFHAAAAAPGVSGPAAEAAGVAAIRLVRLLGPAAQ